MNALVSLHQFSDFGLLILRLVMAAIFYVHGKAKWGMWKMQPSEKLPAPMLNILRLLSIAEPLGALALLVGFLTQPAALGLAIIMAGVVNLKRSKMSVPFSGPSTVGWEYELILLAAAVVLVFTGAGAYGLDRVWFNG
jgi:putative oxidoreductase